MDKDITGGTCVNVPHFDTQKGGMMFRTKLKSGHKDKRKEDAHGLVHIQKVCEYSGCSGSYDGHFWFARARPRR